MTINLEKWQPHIGNRVPGAGIGAMVQEIRNALIEFCERSRVWWVSLDDIAVTDAAHTYDLNPPSGSLVAGILRGNWDGNKIDPVDLDHLDNYEPGWETGTSTGPLYYFRPTPIQIRIVPALASGETGTLGLRVYLKPTPEAGDCPKWLFDEYRNEIAAGAIWKLKKHTGEMYSDPAGASESKMEFYAGCDTARQRHEKGGVKKIRLARTLPFG